MSGAEADGGIGRDLALVRRARAGERQAVAQLLERLMSVPRMLQVINAKRGLRLSSHDLEDVCQDLMIRIWRKLETFEGQATLEHWLYRFAFLEYMNRVRAKDRAAPFEAQELHEVAQGDSPDETFARSEEQELLLRSVDRLPADEANVIRLKHFETRTFEEIALVLGISSNTAKSRYYRGIHRLQRELGPSSAENKP